MGFPGLRVAGGGWCGHVEQGERGLQVEDAFSQEGEAVVEALTAVVEGFVGYC